ncbi:hypothetical protein [Nocardia aurantia]|uniref:Low molecular weight antigen MTB12-like C-terminal domain-containing protein n=1 Tax=Nocardia aurantia TaxID=2585199 RepID=A0A7K0DH55_9NOCA|nr:hypothetical protein [Nocardia aurantia]MQY25143.1 hypothetical protein [Nocardia aurantia]
MRAPIIRHTMTAIACLAVATAALSGCSDDKSDSSSATSSAVATSAAAGSSAASSGSAAAADPATTKAITDAFVGFFNGTAPAASRAALVEKGDQFAPVLAATASNPQAQATSVTVAGVTLKDATHADVKYTLNMAGNPVLPDQTGQAVKDGDSWKVAATTFCALLALQGGGAAVPACS